MPFELKKHVTNPDAEKRPVLTTGITIEEDAIVKKECRELQMTRADFVRMCVADYFIKKSMEPGK